MKVITPHERVLSIDPDANGGYCCFVEGELVDCGHFIRRRKDRFTKVNECLSSFQPEIVLTEYCFRPRSIILNEGIIIGMCMMANGHMAKVYEANPRSWQTVYKRYGDLLDGVEGKERSIAVFESYSSVDLRFGFKNKSDGVADAFCMALWAFKFGGIRKCKVMSIGTG